MPTIQTRSLTKIYRSGDRDLAILQGVDLGVEAGQSVAIVGESGAGKSTLLHLLAGLDTPTSGSISVNGRELSGLNESALADFRNETIGYVWQTYHLLPEFTALENVMMPLLLRGERKESAASTSRKLLAEVGLQERSHHQAGELSGGEQQRVSLARALVTRPAVLLADEPTGNLDEKTGEAVMALLNDLQRRHGLTTVLVTHNLTYARRADQVLRLAGGELHAA